MEEDVSLFGIRGFLIDAPEFGALRGRRGGVVIIENGRISEAGDYDDLRRVPRPKPVRWIDRCPVAIFPGLLDCQTPMPPSSDAAPGQGELLALIRRAILSR